MTNHAIEQEAAKPVTRQARKILPQVNGLCLLTVIIPTILACLYFGLIASDIYISESRFVVRSPQRQTVSSSIGFIMQSAGLSRSMDDSNAVHDYVLSRDALGRLEEKLGLSKAFSSPNVDRIMRFGGLDWDTSFEALYKYYQKRLTATIESSSSITTLSVEAFSPEMAYQINLMLLEMGEDLVNQLNERASHDMIQFAGTEVATAEINAKNAALALSKYRTEKGIYDTTTQSGIQLHQVSKLQDELISAKTQLAQIRSASHNSPSIAVLQERIKLLNDEVKAETAKVAGAQSSLSSHAIEYQRLVLDQTFADKQLVVAFESLEAARNEAMRKQMYLERIVNPNMPDVAIEPRRLKMVLATFLLGLMAWGILSLLVAGVREHRA